MKTILSKQNQTIKDLKKQKLRNRFLLFLDNPKSINDAIASGLSPKLVLVQEGQEIPKLPKTTEIILTSSEVIKSFSDTENPQGMIAVFDFASKAPTVPQGNFLVLDGLQDAGNVGTLLRSALGAGFNQVFLLDCVALTNSKLVRSSMSAILRLKIHEMLRKNFCEFAKENNIALISADMGGKNLYDFNVPKGNCGIVIGSEGAGVSRELLNLSTTTLSIPMAGELESLNAAVAGSIIMFEITNKKGR